MNRESIKYVLRQAIERLLPAARARDLQLPLKPAKVISLVGVRRSGKTFLLFETMRRLVASGVDRARILYLNLADDRLFPTRVEELDLILGAHTELYPAIAGPRYLFLDEVQEVAGWERYVRRLADTEDVHVYLTGSSSRLLTRDLASAMRGRSIAFEVFPLSFREFVRFKGLEHRPHDRTAEARLAHAVEEYVAWGGLPEIVLADETIRPLILEEYASLLFYRDLLERYSVRNERVMRLLLKHCCAHPASLLSVHKLHRDFRSQGVDVSKNTLYEYLGHLQDAYVLFSLPRHEASLRAQERNPRKIHLVDVALTRAYSHQPDAEAGHKLENVVFLEERRRGKNLFYHADGGEVDLVCAGPPVRRFINVAWSLADAVTREREWAAMGSGAARYPGWEGFLVAHETDVPPEKRRTPRVIPAWRYLMEEGTGR